MTCIVAVAKDGIVHMGADGLGYEYSSAHVMQRLDPKLFNNGPYLIGFTTSFRMGQILAYTTVLPEPPERNATRMELHRFMCTEFIDAVKLAFEQGGYVIKNDTSGQTLGGDFIVALHGNIFVVESDFQVSMPGCDYYSLGSGQHYAMGALYATDEKMSPHERLEVALSAAATFNAAVGHPFIFMSETEGDVDAEVVSSQIDTPLFHHSV